MAKLCDICGVRPATVRVRVANDGESQTLDLCEIDYERLARQQRSSSPLESLFGRRGSLFDDFFDDDFFAGRGSDRGEPASGQSIPIESRRGGRSSFDSGRGSALTAPRLRAIS